MDKTHKICSKCKELKPLEDFNFRNRAQNTHHSYCRECGKLLTRNHYKNNKPQYLKRNLKAYKKRRDFVREMKSRPCSDCGIQYPFYVMDFDHRLGELKEYHLNQVDRLTMETLKREIAKCDVVCANCHRERTFQRLKETLKTNSKNKKSE
ncbi:MAG TPA: hypothetical protein VK892_16925 [Pyrinomonadaceae bacterium]|nr:hypothetical protein [Pyrinomonadaceae bacterium]